MEKESFCFIHQKLPSKVRTLPLGDEDCQVSVIAEALIPPIFVQGQPSFRGFACIKIEGVFPQRGNLIQF